jgi:hypothetical protein
MTPSPGGGRQIKRRKVGSAGKKREIIPSSDEDEDGDDGQPEDEDADDVKADEDTEEEEALSPPDMASTSRQISCVRGDNEGEELGVIRIPPFRRLSRHRHRHQHRHHPLVAHPGPSWGSTYPMTDLPTHRLLHLCLHHLNCAPKQMMTVTKTKAASYRGA